MNKIKWCRNQKSGIRITTPNENMCESYIQKSEDSLKVMNVSPSEDWKIITAYYACYDCLYALLQKTGIKCEIHDCTLALMKFFEFSKEEIELLSNLKRKRINVQYYNKKENLITENKVKSFILKCKELIHKSDFKEIRKKIILELKK